MAKRKLFKRYENPTEMLSPIDLLVRDSQTPFFLSVGPIEGNVRVPRMIRFYASSGSWGWVREDRGHGHGSNLRKWAFRGEAQVAIGGTLDAIEWSDWVEAKGEFVEKREGIVLEIRH